MAFRPKHQVLVLKCYPRFQKNVQEVKPNSSELSYLLYYASTRRSKVQKVGSFLEKRTSKDVAKSRTGNVQVTLQILRALINKSPRDLPLYAPYVLRILLAVLNSKDLTTIEDSVPTFQAFCEHQDIATLAADQELVGQYEEVVKHYARLARDAPASSKAPPTAPVRIRWRTAGLQSIKSITGSETIAADGGKQVPMIVSTILEDLDRHSEDQLLTLGQRVNSDKDGGMRRRMSIATVRTSESVPPAGEAVSATTDDADRIAEEEVGLLALQSMRQIFATNNRAQIRLATSSLLKFLMDRPLEPRPETAKSSTRSGKTGTWATTVMDMVSQVTPVQDRFVIVVTAMEILIRSPTSEENLGKQLVLTTLIESLLGSPINMIGLSVMDVLLGLIHHILILLQLGGKGTNILPHHQQTDAIDLFKDNDEAPAILATSDQHPADVPQSSTPSAARQELLSRLKRCIANLATHMYYSDQVSDIVSALLRRLKPSPVSGVGASAGAVEHPGAAAQAISDSINMNEDPSTDEFFSFATARVAALDAVKEVLFTANKRGAFVGAGAIGRNKVSIRVWEGTQWLLRDRDRRVRYSYAEALLTWLRLETTRADLRIPDPQSGTKKPKVNGEAERFSQRSSRVSPSITQAGRGQYVTSSFLQLIHLAAYDDALESPESDADIALLFTLLAALVDKLGVNAACKGLPMILRLQEDAATDALDTARAKMNVSSLVHGYLLYLSKRFELDTTMVGHEIQTEISRRQRSGAWLNCIRNPPMLVDQIALLPEKSSTNTPDAALKPFTSISSLVDQIAFSYSATLQSPPSSPMASPGKSSAASAVNVPNVRSPSAELPASARDSMMAPWSKESCIADLEKDSTRTASPRGSRTGTSNSYPNGLLSANGHTPRDLSPGMAASRSPMGESPGPPLPNLKTVQPRGSPRMSGPPTPTSNSDDPYTLRVEDMKRVLAGGSLSEAFSARPRQPSLRSSSPLRNSSAAHDVADRPVGRGLRGPSLLSVGSDSIVDAEGFESASEGDPSRPLPSPQKPPPSAAAAHQYMEAVGAGRRRSRGSASLRRGASAGADPDEDPRPPSSAPRGRPRSGSETSAEDPRANAQALKGELEPEVLRGSVVVARAGVPPVPPLPEGLAGTGGIAHPARAADGPTVRGGSVRDRSAGRSSEGRGHRARDTGQRRIMVQALLGSIEVSSAEGSKGIGLPPY